jgi:hypothetical protein
MPRCRRTALSATSGSPRLRSRPLYTSYFAENVALLAIIVGIVMLLVGIGFVVLTVFSRRRAPGAAGPEAPPGGAAA